jgi:arylsulfatase A-like enzyme
MMAWGPKWVKKKQVLSTMISSMDIFPTALEAAGIDISPSLKLDGKSFLSLLSKKSQKPIHDCLVWANRNSLSWSYRAPGISKTRNVPAAWTIKKGKWMLHYFSGQGKYKLYNYAKDLGEKNDLHEKYPEVAKELKKDYASWFASAKKPLYWNLETWYGLIPDEQRTPEQNKAMKSKLAEYAAKIAKQKN